MLCCWELNEIKPFNNEKGKTNSNHMLTMLKRGHKVECDYWSRAVVVPYTQAKWYFSLDSTPEGSLPCPNKGLLHCYDWLNPFLMLKKGEIFSLQWKICCPVFKVWLVSEPSGGLTCRYLKTGAGGPWRLVLLVRNRIYHPLRHWVKGYRQGWIEAVLLMLTLLCDRYLRSRSLIIQFS